MLFLIALILAFAFAFSGGKALKKNPYVFYGAAILLTVGMAYLPSVNTRDLPVFVNVNIIGLFTRGAFATALWCVVMITGALPNGSAPIKKLMPVRGELSIFAAILTLGHNIGYGRTYFTMMFTNRDRMSDNQLYAGICTIVMLLIMIPLTIMSFPKVRRKMNARLWKKIQRTAYLFYALIYIHVMLLTMPMARSGRRGYILSVFVYTLVFFGYAFFRMRKFILRNKAPHKKIAVNTAFTFTVLVICFITLSARPVKSDQNTEKPAAVKTFSISTTAPARTNTAVTAVSTETAAEVKTTAAASTASVTSVTTVSAGQTTSEVNTEDAAETRNEDEDVTEAFIPEQDIPLPETETNEPETPPEPQYIYNNGDFSASAYGYDGDIYITITIENDIITNISGYSDESDSWYFDSASGQVIPDILNSQTADVDAYSGATYSSDAIMKAVKKALESAKKQ